MAPIITTDRLILRPPMAEDFDAWADFTADAEAMRFLGGAQPRALAWRSFAAVAGSWMLHGFGFFSVIERATGRWVGRLGPWRPEGWPGNEIGWGLARAAWGKGYAVEGAAAAMDWAFAELGWHEVVHCIDPENAASLRVAERLGSTYRFTTEVPPPFHGQQMLAYGQSSEQWRARRTGGPLNQ